jgi:hypothetical protein
MDKKNKTKAETAKKSAQKKASKAKEAAAKKVRETKKKTSEIKNEIKDSSQEVKEDLRKAGERISESGFWEEASENISEGAKIIGDEARVIGEKISAYSEILFGKIRDTSAEAFKSGLDLTREGVNKAQELAEDLRGNIEVNRLNKKKKDLASQLGMKFYLEVKNNDNQIPDNLLRKRVFMSLLKEMENIDKEILEISSD